MAEINLSNQRQEHNNNKKKRVNCIKHHQTLSNFKLVGHVSIQLKIPILKDIMRFNSSFKLFQEKQTF